MENDQNTTSFRHQNSLDFVRLVLATLVVFSHSSELMDGNDSREVLFRIFGSYSFGAVAVNAFFVLSGFLVTQSWFRDPRVWPFLRKRILRIYPGFIVACLITGLVLAPFGTKASTYWHTFRPMKFFIGLFFLQQFVPESFQGLPYRIVNSSLWTIPFEFLCYGMVCVTGKLKLLRQELRNLFPVVAIAMMTWFLAHTEGWIHFAASERTEFFLTRFDLFCRLGAYFLCGIACAFYRDQIEDTISIKRGRWRVVFWLLLCLGLFTKSTADYAMMFCGAPLLLHFGTKRARWLQKFPITEDYSYGTYLYSWTIQQLIILKIVGITPMMVFVLALPLGLGAGILSWKLIEKPCLKLK